ncbi:MAG: hypothetical protein ACT4QC_19555 [Planctomycetaceae bacterium]
MFPVRHRFLGTALNVMVCALLSLSGGCERKEKILDIKAPGIDIEVERSSKGIDGTIKTEPRERTRIRAPGTEIDAERSPD